MTTCRTSNIGRKAAPGHRRIDTGRFGVPAQGRGRGRHHQGRRGAVCPSGHRDLGAETRTCRSWATTRPSGSPSSRLVVSHGTDGFLHHNYVVALLNDLFGIQSRGGCSCAGPYGHRLLGIDLDQSHEFEREITRGCEGIKPGWVRINFNYFINDETFPVPDRGGRPGGDPRGQVAVQLPVRAGQRALDEPHRGKRR